MAIRRTRESIPMNQTKKLNVQYSYHAPTKPIEPVTTSKPKSSISSSRSLFNYDVKLIFNDLKKTVLITIIIFIILLGITWYLKR